jgi:hypothetical protein
MPLSGIDGLENKFWYIDNGWRRHSSQMDVVDGLASFRSLLGHRCFRVVSVPPVVILEAHSFYEAVRPETQSPAAH